MLAALLPNAARQPLLQRLTGAISDPATRLQSSNVSHFHRPLRLLGGVGCFRLVRSRCRLYSASC